MAKGARSSAVKKNNATLRAKIFGPAVDERTARLSARLQELISKPRPNEKQIMDVDTIGANEEDAIRSSMQLENEMDIDTKSVSTKRKSMTKKTSSRIEKKHIKKKPKNQVVFPTSAAKRKRIAQSKKKSV